MNNDTRLLLEKTSAALEKNNMKCFIAKTKEDVLPIVKKLLDEGCTVATGGSVTLNECGVTDYLRSGAFNFLDRTGLSGDELKKCFRAAFSADAYLCSSNAITENGELYNVDGNANRVSAICYGPDSVIIVAGVNKIVPDINAAVKRIKNVCTNKNSVRLGLDTYCSKKGACCVNVGCDGDFADGCKSTEARMCCSFVITSFQRAKYRIKVILVGEELGY